MGCCWRRMLTPSSMVDGSLFLTMGGFWYRVRCLRLPQLASTCSRIGLFMDFGRNTAVTLLIIDK